MVYISIYDTVFIYEEDDLIANKSLKNKKLKKNSTEIAQLFKYVIYIYHSTVYSFLNYSIYNI